ncbi:MAG: phospholipid carrier-dependent glycosyltransferase [Actinobacteria bacterium]|nr:phospholipid carrier-dependent glycosyltransferase [Actinomycetota bacterium]MBM2827819.1 phospholipid carrier-dependent glycosyltransferase [Actinomycetota bacterium]
MSGAGNGADRRDRAAELPGIGFLFRYRFVKFGAVGSSGVIVNFAVLYLGQEYLFRGIRAEQGRLSLSLAAAIAVATFNNFLWNRMWTWGDRKDQEGKGFFTQMGQYYVACWLAIAVQFLLTKVLALSLHYLAANLIAVGLSAAVNFFMNHRWTFALREREEQK